MPTPLIQSSKNGICHDDKGTVNQSTPDILRRLNWSYNLLSPRFDVFRSGCQGYLSRRNIRLPHLRG